MKADNRRRRFDNADPGSNDPHVAHPELAQHSRRSPHLISRRRPLHRQHQAVPARQAVHQHRQALKRGDGACRHRVRVKPTGKILSAASLDPDISQPKLGGTLAQKGRPARHRLNQHHLDARPQDGQHDARQPRAGAKVSKHSTVRHKLGDHAAVQQMPFPDPPCLGRADQPALDAGASE